MQSPTVDGTTKPSDNALASSEGNSGKKPPIELTSPSGGDEDNDKPKRTRVVISAPQTPTANGTPKTSEDASAASDGNNVWKPPEENMPPADGDDNDDKLSQRKKVAIPSAGPSEIKESPEWKGYGVSRFNALTSGLYSTAELLLYEDPEEDEKRYQERRAHWRPVGIEEEEQVLKIHQIRREEQRVARGVPGIFNKKLLEVISTKEDNPYAGAFRTDDFADLDELNFDLIIESFTLKKEADLDELKVTRDLILSMKSELKKIKTKADKRKAYERVVKDLPPDVLQLWQEKQNDLEIRDDPEAVVTELVRFLRVDAIGYLDRERLKIRSRLLVRETLASFALDPDAYAGVDRRTTTLIRQYVKAVEILLKLQWERTEREKMIS